MSFCGYVLLWVYLKALKAFRSASPGLGSRGLISAYFLFLVPCLKILLSKGLGLCIVAGSLLGMFLFIFNSCCWEVGRVLR